MARVSKTGATGSFYCPGCQVFHTFGITADNYNGNDNLPSVTPWLTYANGGGQVTCKALIRDGRATFGSDSRHQWAGQTVDLPNITGGIPK